VIQSGLFIFEHDFQHLEYFISILEKVIALIFELTNMVLQ